MFESLTDKLSSALRNLRGVGKLSEENMAAALAEVRTALLTADVHFKVAREFVERVQAQCAGQEVLKGVTPGQQIVKIIHDELVRLLGEGSTALSAARPLKVMMVGPPWLRKDDLDGQARPVAQETRIPSLRCGL